MLEAIYNWLLEFEAGLDAEFLADEDGAVSVEAEPGNVTVKRYVDGGELRQFIFVVAFREDYGVSTEENMKAGQYFEKLQKWIDEKNAAREWAGELF
ncbi:MAG: hypothetical protein LUG52_10635 [Clostridia bacterium]|nr:hypothetical protein [Clostridia bacterium]